MTDVDAMLERLRPHVEKLLSDDELTGFALFGRLEGEDWDISRRADCSPKVIKKLRTRGRHLTIA